MKISIENSILNNEDVRKGLAEGSLMKGETSDGNEYTANLNNLRRKGFESPEEILNFTKYCDIVQKVVASFIGIWSETKSIEKTKEYVDRYNNFCVDEGMEDHAFKFYTIPDGTDYGFSGPGLVFENDVIFARVPMD